jgi:hypothetical protein
VPAVNWAGALMAILALALLGNRQTRKQFTDH